MTDAKGKARDAAETDQTSQHEREAFEKNIKKRAFHLYKKHITGRGYAWPVGCSMPDDVQTAVIEGMREMYEAGLQAALKHAQQSAESERMSEVNNVTARGLYFDSDRQHELERDGPTEEEMLTLLADDDQRRRNEIREKALEQAAKICDGVNNYDNPMTAGDCADAIRNLKSQQPAQADKPDIESTHAARAIAAYEASGATTPWTYLDPTEWSKWEKIADAVHALSKG